jgi:PTH2 family peptidyl-tRNA hydrolase
MGISENAAVRGLYNTGNTSPDLAAAWVFDNLEDPQLHQPFSPPAGPPVDVKSIQATIDESRLFKMIFIVNTSLKMGVGKVAAQVGHATLALYKTLLIDIGQQQNVRDWEEKGAKKIVLRGNDEEHLMLLKSEAKGLHIPHIIIKDAGKTQVEPGSITVLAVFGKGYEVDEVTGKLSLL